MCSKGEAASKSVEEEANGFSIFLDAVNFWDTFRMTVLKNIFVPERSVLSFYTLYVYF